MSAEEDQGASRLWIGGEINLVRVKEWFVGKPRGQDGPSLLAAISRVVERDNKVLLQRVQVVTNAAPGVRGGVDVP